MIASINPATGATWRTFEALSENQVEDKLRRAAAAYQAYRRTSFAERARWLNAAAEILESDQDRLGRVITLEMGKNIGAARAEVAKCALCNRFTPVLSSVALANVDLPTFRPDPATGAMAMSRTMSHIGRRMPRTRSLQPGASEDGSPRADGRHHNVNGEPSPGRRFYRPRVRRGRCRWGCGGVFGSSQ